MAEPNKPALPRDVEGALERGDFIGAIKLLRSTTGLGLQDARSAIDRFRRRGPASASDGSTGRTMQQGLQHGEPARGSVALPDPAFANMALPPPVVEAIHAGHTLEAIRLMREHSGLGLKQAKDAVDRYADQHRVAFGPLSPGEVPRTRSRLWLGFVVVAAMWLAWRMLRPGG